MKTCDEMLELISLRLDGGLTDEQELELAEHLATCPECRALADDLADIHAAMAGMSAPAPAFLTENVMERVRASASAPIPFPERKNTRHWRAWGATAAALVLVAAGAFALRGGINSGGPAPAGAPMTLGIAPSAAAPSPTPVQPKEQTSGLVGEYGGEGQDHAQEDATDDTGLGNERAAMPTEAPRTRSADSTPPAAPAAPPSAGQEEATYGKRTPASVQITVAPEETTPVETPPVEIAPVEPIAVEPTEPPAPAMNGFAYTTAGVALTPVEAAKKLYEEKFAQLYPDYDVGNLAVGSDGYVACHFADAKLEYVEPTADGGAYLFRYTVLDEENARYLVPLDGSDIQTVDGTETE